MISAQQSADIVMKRVKECLGCGCWSNSIRATSFVESIPISPLTVQSRQSATVHRSACRSAIAARDQHQRARCIAEYMMMIGRVSVQLHSVKAMHERVRVAATAAMQPHNRERDPRTIYMRVGSAE